ncbi:MAG: hypothetical protein EZS28_028091 [Streblomastix strix]|uniref:Uncharacterized protein n=1 Tax=Streblomastix strix TaxID=222440 RepID=A0A5J4V1Y5_9EUKA|nr:MAG: hypothetical protein EZS28_028091 [Streblomastix strix]
MKGSDVYNKEFDMKSFRFEGKGFVCNFCSKHQKQKRRHKGSSINKRCEALRKDYLTDHLKSKTRKRNLKAERESRDSQFGKDTDEQQQLRIKALFSIIKIAHQVAHSEIPYHLILSLIALNIEISE